MQILPGYFRGKLYDSHEASIPRSKPSRDITRKQTNISHKERPKKSQESVSRLNPLIC
jgi:hypothetical protein